MQVFIHVGYPKAGSSFIQKEILKGGYEPCQDITFKDATPERKTAEKLIISNETLVMGDWVGDNLRVDTPENIAKRLKEYYPEAVIVIVIRPQDEWLESWWRHIVNSSSPYCGLSLPQLMKTDFWHKNIRPYLDYDKMIKIYVGLFGQEKIKVLNLKDKDFAEKFCSIIGIEPPDGLRPRRVSRSHSISVVKMYLNRIYLKFNKKISDRWFYLMKHYVGRLDFFLKYLERKRKKGEGLTRPH